MSITAARLVAREEELGALVGVLDEPGSLPRAVLLRGEAGIGKTTLWLAGLDHAARRGFRVLASRPAEADTGFAYAGLTDLLAAAADEVLPELPPIQRRALEAAMLLGNSRLDGDERAVGAAFLGALRRLAARGPVCVAVDDLQWLDAASLSALRFALARLDGERVVALLAVRGEVPAWMRRGVVAERLVTIRVDGLTVGGTYELLRARLDAVLPRPTLIRIWETSNGNPFFALELAAALQRRDGPLGPADELPVPTDVDELLRRRLDGLSPAALTAVRVVAALADPTVQVVEAAVGRRFDPALAEALDDGILELDADRLRLAHPLLGPVASAGLTPARRRSLHARLAGLVPNVEERARHLALATTDADGAIAATLEDAARSAQSRGAPAAAAALAEQAFRRTPPADGPAARRRLFLAADRHHVSGDAERALALLEQARAESAPGPERAAVLIRLGDVVNDVDGALASEPFHRQALEEAGGDDALEARICTALAEVTGSHVGLEHAVGYATRAVEAASRSGDPALDCRARAVHANWRFRAGHGVDRADLGVAMVVERTLPGWPLVSGPTEYLGPQLVWSGDLAPARMLLLELRNAQRAQDRSGDECWALWHLCLLELRAGNWDDAERHGLEFVDLQTQLGLVAFDEFPVAAVAAHRGRVDDARATLDAELARVDGDPFPVAQSLQIWLLGFIELSLGDPRAALGHLRRAHELRNLTMLEPAQRLELGDLLEALIALGELGEAEGLLGLWEPRAAALDRAWALAILARGRGLLFAAHGDLDAAFASFDRALAEHGRSTDPFQHTRTLLALGRTQRRAKRRGDARRTLEDALGRFDALGAPLWAEQARAELQRIGGRAAASGDLTEAESRIARLVAQGRTNREVAAELFLTEHSVETALTRIYRKLGVRSRVELTRLLAAKT